MGCMLLGNALPSVLPDSLLVIFFTVVLYATGMHMGWRWLLEEIVLFAGPSLRIFGTLTVVGVLDAFSMKS